MTANTPKRIEYGCSFPASSARFEPTGETFHTPRHTWLAWRMPMDPAGSGAELARWLLHCPYAHPVWERWLISLAHLRPMPGLPDADGTGHQVAIFAIDPDANLVPDPDVAQLPPRCLMQPPVIETFPQFGEDDAAALARVEKLIEMTVRRALSPDDDYRALWRQLLNMPAPFIH